MYIAPTNLCVIGFEKKYYYLILSAQGVPGRSSMLLHGCITKYSFLLLDSLSGKKKKKCSCFLPNSPCNFSISTRALFQAGNPQLSLSLFRESSTFPSFLVIILGLSVGYVGLLNFDKCIFHFILSHFVHGGFLLPLAINLFSQH